jgi:uncharacterized protein YwbE
MLLTVNRLLKTSVTLGTTVPSVQKRSRCDGRFNIAKVKQIVTESSFKFERGIRLTLCISRVD